jgi:putative addiction module component (TIGR02574 family)
MSKADILEQLPSLKPEERQEIRAKLNELDGLSGGAWANDELTDAEKSILDRELVEYKKNPEAGSAWEEIEARIREQPNK